MTPTENDYLWLIPPSRINKKLKNIQMKKLMHSKTYYFVILLCSALLFSCEKKPEACFTLSNSNPSLFETITFNSSCSKNTRWVDYSVDGKKIGSGGAKDEVEYAFTTTGDHAVTMTVYSSFNGSFSSRSGCANCSGSGRSSKISKMINVLPLAAPVVSYNSPVAYDETLNLKATSVEGAEYSWTGPDNFTSTKQNPDIYHVTGANAGTYSVVANMYGNVSQTGTLVVSFTPVNAPCSPANNTATFTGGFPSLTYTSVRGSATSYPDQYQLSAIGNQANISILFKNITVPFDGVYTITDGTLDNNNEVNMQVSNMSMTSSVNSGKLYVKVINGKVSATFCSVKFYYDNSLYTCSGKITAQ